MVEKMKLLHFTGPRNDIDRVMSLYLEKYEIHFENAMTSLSELGDVGPFVETNMYREPWQKGKELLVDLGWELEQGRSELRPEEARNTIYQTGEIIDQIRQKKQALIDENKKLEQFMEHIEPFRKLDFEFAKMLEFRFIKFRMGRIPIEYYHRLSNYIKETAYTLFYECFSDDNYVWGVYFMPYVHSVEVDAVYLSFHFERVFTEAFVGTPEDACVEAKIKIRENETTLSVLTDEMHQLVTKKKDEIIAAYLSLDQYCKNFEIRKLAVCTRPKKDRGEYYILYGWMSSADTVSLKKEIEKDEKFNCIEEEIDENTSNIPPTRLKNPKILKPFEMFVEMYGLPAYNEMDPTIFIALTYTLMFGIMFGDVGQGLCLVGGGFLLYRKNGMRLAGIVALAGLWSTFFGFMYGSLFGFEEVLHAIWMRPMENIMDTLMMAIAFGGVLILIAMLLNIVNAIRAKEYGRLFFHHSGLAGLICYGFAALCIALFATGNALPAMVLIVIFVGVPLLIILFQEPLTHLVEKKEHILPKGSKAMFLVEALVEGFDVVLSYATNTISFVRVGAFALSHAGMMGVVLTLAGLEAGKPNWLIVILGNILVTGLEGLVVGIQVLRLEYYEMFSRFYKGSGKPFMAFHKK